METILVIEDDPAISLGLKKNLKYEGYDVVTTAQGDQGLELAISRRPDLIVLDVMLPALNGFEICKTLKPSNRGELEITDVNNAYIARNELTWNRLDGWWTDAGTFPSLYRANELVAKAPESGR